MKTALIDVEKLLSITKEIWGEVIPVTTWEFVSLLFFFLNESVLMQPYQNIDATLLVKWILANDDYKCQKPANQKQQMLLNLFISSCTDNMTYQCYKTADTLHF